MHIYTFIQELYLLIKFNGFFSNRTLKQHLPSLPLLNSFLGCIVISFIIWASQIALVMKFFPDMLFYPVGIDCILPNCYQVVTYRCCQDWLDMNW